MIRLAILATDNREHHRKYGLTEPYFGPAIEALLQGLSESPDLEVHVVSCTQRPMSSPEKLFANTWFHSLHVPKIGWLRTGYQGCIRAIRKKLRELRPDIVHGQGTERECAISAAFSGFPNVITLHGIMSAMEKKANARIGSFLWCAAKLERFTLPRTLGVFCNSAYTESMVRSRARRTWRVPNAIRREFFETPVSTKRTGPKPILLNIGTVSSHKRQLELLQLAGQLARQGNSFELHFIGATDPGDAYSAAFVKEIEIAEREGYARYVGLKSLPELIITLDEAVALVHAPSEEAFGLVVAEALARNLKLFATDTGGVAEVAGQVGGVEIVPSGDFEALGSALSSWIQSNCPPPPASVQKIRARYHPELIAKRHVEIYRAVLGPA